LAKIEYLDGSQWIHYNWHKNSENAIIVAEVYSKSRKRKTRVINKGQIIYESEKDNG
jgi:hypothetical protein